MTDWHISPGGSLTGELKIPGDKSISHRAVMLGSLASGTTRVTNFLEGEDTRATARAFRDMGVTIEADGDGGLTIEGRGLAGLHAPSGDIDLGNSGTAMRLMAGVLAGQSFSSVLRGDESLNGRPMARITHPLGLMGATVMADSDGTPPLKIAGGASLRGVRYTLPVASAQIKSCMLLAGLYAQGETEVESPETCRDHTERMLCGFGYDVRVDNLTVTLSGGGKLVANDVHVPGDVSSAAFFLMGASIAPGSDLTLRHVGMNPTRRGVVDILRLMGADITALNEHDSSGEPVADLRVRYAPLRGISIPSDLVANAIDEFPSIFVAAACADGVTELSGAAELRVKESDRIGAMADGLATLGVNAQARADGMVIKGVGGDSPAFRGGRVTSRGDHRIAMSLGMAALRASAAVVVEDCDNVATSFPSFTNLVSTAGMTLEASN